MEPTRIAQAVSSSAFNLIGELLGPGLALQADASSSLKHKPEIEQSLIEVTCKQEIESPTTTIVLMLHFNHRSRQMKIPNIMMPRNMIHQRLGKRTIGELYKVAEAFDYELIVTDLVDSFYDRLVRRGAEVVDEHTLKITSATNMTGDVGSPTANRERQQPFDLYSLILGGTPKPKDRKL